VYGNSLDDAMGIYEQWPRDARRAVRCSVGRFCLVSPSILWPGEAHALIDELGRKIFQ